MKIIVLGLLTAVAFAANSILNRAALEADLIDPFLFSLIRISSAALVLTIILIIRKKATGLFLGRWKPAIYLVVYVFGFSIAYSYVNSATGALILFATVQFVMIGSSYMKGHRLSLLEWIGIFLSISGFLILLLPGIGRPSLVGFFLMVASGFGWGLFSLSGMGSKDAMQDVARGFVKAMPIAFVLSLPFVGNWHTTSNGVFLALASGIFASGFGYCIWYLMLPLISASSAAVFQLLVPVLVAIMGVVILDEEFTSQLLISGSLVLVGLAWYARARFVNQRSR